MNQVVQFLLRHGYSLLFAAVFAEQLGVPVPAVPVLLAMGALAGLGRFSFTTVLLVAVPAAVLADLVWYELGRRHGYPVLRLICRISLEPDSCARRTEDLFERLGPRALLVAKFFPGFSTAAPPMAGMFFMPLWRFLISDGLGALLWAGMASGAGYLFRAQLERVAAVALRLGGGLVVLLAAGLAAYIARKYVERRRFLRQLNMARITPEELKRKLDAGEGLVVVDLRHTLEFEADGATVPGALHLPPQDLPRRHHEIPRDRDVVLYCT